MKGKSEMWVLILLLGGTAVSTDKVAWYPTEAACRSALNAFGPNGVVSRPPVSRMLHCAFPFRAKNTSLVIDAAWDR
jgi:hypothetical protein